MTKEIAANVVDEIVGTLVTTNKPWLFGELNAEEWSEVMRAAAPAILGCYRDVLNASVDQDLARVAFCFSSLSMLIFDMGMAMQRAIDAEQ